MFSDCVCLMVEQRNLIWASPAIAARFMVFIQEIILKALVLLTFYKQLPSSPGGLQKPEVSVFIIVSEEVSATFVGLLHRLFLRGGLGSHGCGRRSNGGASRIYRKTGTDVHVAAMAQAALPLFKQLEAEGGRQLLTTSGCALSEKGMLRVTMCARCVRCAAGCERYTYT